MTEPKLLTLEELSELERLHEAATPGHWERDMRNQYVQDLLHDAVFAADGRTICDTLNAEHRELTHDGDAWSDSVGAANMKLIAAMRNALPGLLAAARRGMEADDTIRRIGLLLAGNGCDCECDHHAEEHEDDCSRCLACLVELTIKTGVGFLGLGNKGDGNG